MKPLVKGILIGGQNFERIRSHAYEERRFCKESGLGVSSIRRS